MSRWPALMAVTVVLAVTPACATERSPIATSICDEEVPAWVTAAPSTVADIRHFKTGNLQTVSPFAHAFGSVPGRAPAAWCWVGGRPKTFRDYAATGGQKPIVIAEISGASDTPPTGAPTIL